MRQQVEVRGYIIEETWRAVRFRPRASRLAVWLPRRLVAVGTLKSGVSLSLPRWLAKKKGLDGPPQLTQQISITGTD
jgi:hypothetical protein